MLYLRQFIPLVLITGLSLFAQDAATLSVHVYDPFGALVPDAGPTFSDTARGVVKQLSTDENGFALFDHLEPGIYALQVEKQGFEKVRLTPILLTVRDRQNLRIELKVAAATQSSIEVTDRVEAVSADPAAGIAVEKEFTQNLPINGRNPESLIMMTPGISSAAGGRGGMGFNTNGLRENMNYYTLDGISVDSPMGGGGMMGGGPGGMFGAASGRKYNLTLSLSAWNILNHANYAAPSGDLSSPFFGQYRSLAGFGPFDAGNNTYNRKIDVQLRFTF